VAFTEKLATRKPKTASEHYDAWLDSLPDSEREVVVQALTDKHSYPHVELKPILESDEDHPAPKFGATAFREWRSEITA
jgi:hypothetical protein